MEIKKKNTIILLRERKKIATMKLIKILFSNIKKISNSKQRRETKQ